MGCTTSDGSDSRSSGTYYFRAFSSRFENDVGSVSGLGLEFWHQQESSTKVIFLRWMCLYQQESSAKVVDSSKCFGAPIPYFLSKFVTQFIVIVVVRLCLTHSNRCGLTKNMIWGAPMGPINRTSDSSSRGTDTTAFIQYINGRETQINELWCLGLDRICRKIHPTAHV